MPRIASEDFYNNAIKKHGLTPQGVCWLSFAHQQIRFDVICELLPDNLAEYSLTDAGCGFSDFYSYLQNNGKLPNKYRGIDSLNTMCAIAKKKTDQEILHADITNTEVPVSDYVICSGAMNVLTPFETNLFINNCFTASKKAFIFNILCAEDNSQTYNYLPKEKITEMATALKVKKVLLREDYINNDITVGFFK
ncbi:class I SAM-dependent methyltransferase [Sulfurimonas indica]|uniref:class I SAM-dependent methyltransferase n=1 Tax=Sulfurimonas indica TaxID=2508707 RepID=UPI0012648D7C|nr:class I SAM-dependent methyltransferase [Sulfurimonas indica]